MLRRLGLFALSIAAFVLFLELFSLVAYYYQTGHLFYTFRHTYQAIDETRHERLTGEGLHPYFGPTHRPGLPFELPKDLQRAPVTGSPSPRALVKTNNFGFASAHDYPFAADPEKQFVIGLFGGSVGVWFCHVGADRLVAELKRHDFFKGREPVPLCFSHEGYKQPQQLQLLAYFLSIGQRFDLVISIDGFNEIALGGINHKNGLDVSMPSFFHLDPLKNLIDRATLTPQKLQVLAQIDRDKRRLNDLAASINENRLASINLAYEQYYKAVMNRYRAAQVTFNSLESNPTQSSLIQPTPPVKPREGTPLYQDIAANWARASMQMNDMLAARRVRYVHVLQPNQYYTKRRFSDAEARVALITESPFKEHIEKGYSSLVAEAESGPLEHAVEFVNAIDIFDNEPRPVYLDNCCHYTLVGNDLLADVVARRILSPHQRTR